MAEGNDTGDLTYEELLEHALDLQKQLDERDEKIAELTTAARRGRRGAGNSDGGNDFAYQEQQIKELTTKTEEDAATINKLREDLASANIKIQRLNEDKTNLEKTVKSNNQRIEQLQKEMSDLLRKSEVVESKHRETNKQKSDNVRMAQQMAKENELVRLQNDQLNEELREYKDKVALLEEVLTKQASEKDELEVLRDNLDLALEASQAKIIDLESDVAELTEKLDEYAKAEAELERKNDQLVKEIANVKQESSKEIIAARNELSEARAQVLSLKDNTQSGKLQRQIDDLSRQVKERNEIIDQLREQLENIIEERDTLAEQVSTMQADIEQEVINKVSGEKHRNKNLEQAIERLQEKHRLEIEELKAIVAERDELLVKVDELNFWKEEYEAGHALQQLSRSQKKLSEDNRKLTQVIQQKNLEIGMLMDSNEALHLCFERLKKECKKPADFKYDDLEIHREVKSRIQVLESQVKDLEGQMDLLEEENTNLRKTIRSQAGSYTEQGFKYAGMTPEQLMKVNEFAANLRENKLELPLNDRSRELLQENKQLKADMQVLKAQINNLEKNIQYTSGNENVLNDAFGADIKSLLSENANMHRRMAELQFQLDNLIQSNASNGDSGKDSVIKAADLQQILNANSELVLKEIEHIRRAQQEILNSRVPAQATAAATVSDQHAFTTNNNNIGLPPSGRFRSTVQNNAPVANTYMKGSQFDVFNTPRRDYTPQVNNNTAMNNPAQTQASFMSTPFYRQPTPIQQNNLRDQRANQSYYNTPQVNAQFSTASLHQASQFGPQTPHGKQLLTSNIYNMNLPPEDWAIDVKHLNMQLVECLEQLYEREKELEDRAQLIQQYEETLAQMKLQVLVLYHEYSEEKQQWTQQEKTLKEEFKVVFEERDDLKLKIRRLQDLTEVLQSRLDHQQGSHAEGASALPEMNLVEMTRKLIVHEVNEAVLSRKYVALSEQVEMELARRRQLEVDFSEMEAALKQRILFLEQYKLAAGGRLAYLQSKLDESVPSDDYLALNAEMDNLREDHLNTLRREVEARIAALQTFDHARELRSLRILNSHLTSECAKYKENVLALANEVSHQKELTDRALQYSQSASNKSSESELASIISEMAKFRGESTRLQVELNASNRRHELLTKNLDELLGETEKLTRRIRELEARESEYSSKESAARQELLEIKLKFEGGFTKDEKERFMTKLEKSQQSLEEKDREIARLKGIADIAAQQAQTMQVFKNNLAEEMKELREYCVRLEARSEDEILIGKLQRQLMTTKASYKAFVRKYQYCREQLREKELCLLLVENKLSEQEKVYHESTLSRRNEILALKKALRNLKETMMESVITGGLFNNQENSVEDQPQRQQQQQQQQQHARSQWRSKSKLKKSSSQQKLVTIGIGKKVLDISRKVDQLEQLAEDAVTKAAQRDEECRQLAGDNEDLLAEKHILTQRLQDLETLLHSQQTATSTHHATSTAKSATKLIASKLIAMSEEVRVTKLSNLSYRRQLNALREESKYLRNLLQQVENDVIELERGHVKLETDQSFLKSHANDAQREKTDVFFEEEFDLHFEENALKNAQSASSLQLDLQLITGEKTEENLRGLDAEELLDKNEALQREVHLLQKQVSELKLQSASAKERSKEVLAGNHEKEEQLKYYEKILQEHNLQGLLLRPSTSAPHQLQHQLQGGIARNASTMSLAEQEKLQDAATATIGSLKALLEEKNRLLEKYREKVEFLQQAIGPHNKYNAASLVSSHKVLSKSRAEKHADYLLEKIAIEDENQLQHQHHQPSATAGVSSASQNQVSQLHQSNKQLIEQLERADEIIKEKEQLLGQVEAKLLQQQQQRERAEIRCGEALKEIDSMKEDMLTLIDQLQEAQAKLAHMQKFQQMKVITSSSVAGKLKQSQQLEDSAKESHEHTNTNNNHNNIFTVEEQRLISSKLKDLERAVKQRDDRVKHYREIIIKLKEEFIKTEQEKASFELLMRQKLAGQPAAASVEEVREVRGKLREVQESLAQAREDLEKARRVREKLLQEKKQLAEDCQAQEQLKLKLEAQLNHVVQSGQRVKQELEETKRKEVRLREKLREYMNAGAGGASNQNNAGKTARDGAGRLRERVEELERENDLLRAQNAALKHAENVEQLIARDIRGHEQKEQSDEPAESSGANKSTRGHVLGEANNNNNNNNNNDLRQQLHSKWENEKKLQKRGTVLEKRVEELLHENDELRAQLQRSKESLAQAIAAKDELLKQKHRPAPAAGQSESQRKASHADADGLSDLEQLRARIFNLEEQLQQSNRIAQVEQVNQIRSLTHQLSLSQSRISDLEKQLQEHEERRKKLHGSGLGSGLGGGQGSGVGSALRGSEDRFLREERLRDELDFCKRQKLELEATVLDRDARALEQKFDLEAGGLEIARLRRRVKELEQALRSAGSSNSNFNFNASKGNTAGAGQLSRREQELESVIDALKRVVDKLKAENDRLKRGIGVSDGHPDGAGNKPDYEKRVVQERRRAEKLEEELKLLQEKVRQSEESAQKAAAKQQQLLNLRRQLKAKEDETAAAREELAEARAERDNLKRKLKSAEEKVQALELTVQRVASSTSTSSNNNFNNNRETDELRRTVSTKQAELDVLRAELADARQKFNEAQVLLRERERESAGSGLGGGERVVALQNELRRLREENEKLKRELSAFDLDFFEEIENLKYAHAEAIRKLKVYESNLR